ERVLQPRRYRCDRGPSPGGPLGELAPSTSAGARLRALVRARCGRRARQGLRPRRVPLAALPLLALVRRNAQPGARSPPPSLRAGNAAPRPAHLLADGTERVLAGPVAGSVRPRHAVDPRVCHGLGLRGARRLRVRRRAQPPQGAVMRVGVDATSWVNTRGYG